MRSTGPRKLLALSSAVAFAVPLAIGSGAAVAQPAELIPGLTDSAFLDGAVIASGTLFGTAGELAPEGTVVSASAWPSPETLAAMAIGESVKITPVAVGITARDGSFSLRYSNPELLEQYISPSTGLVELEVAAVVNGAPAIHNISRAVNSPASRTANGQSAVDTSPIELNAISGEGSPASLVDSDGQASIHNKSCTGTKVADYTTWVNVGQGFGSTSTTMTFTYSNGSSSALGVGVSVSGAYGTYSASGTSSVSASGSVGYAAVSGTANRSWDTQFRYSKFRYYCYTQNPSTTYQVRPVAWVGGARANVLSTAPSATSCANFGAGSSFTKNTSSATTYSGGAQTSGAIGINLSAKTGYTNSTSIKFSFGVSRRLCGTTGFPGATPGRLVAKA